MSVPGPSTDGGCRGQSGQDSDIVLGLTLTDAVEKRA